MTDMRHPWGDLRSAHPILTAALVATLVAAAGVWGALEGSVTVP